MSVRSGAIANLLINKLDPTSNAVMYNVEIYQMPDGYHVYRDSHRNEMFSTIEQVSHFLKPFLLNQWAVTGMVAQAELIASLITDEIAPLYAIADEGHVLFLASLELAPDVINQIFYELTGEKGKLVVQPREKIVIVHDLYRGIIN